VIDALLAHLRLHRVTPDVDGLFAVHRAYLARVPYEDIAVQLGETGPLDEAALTERVLSGRGGYCFELNTVLAALLRGIGFDVTHYQAVVGGEGPTNHMALLVRLDDGAWLADAGLGEGFLDPLPLREGTYSIGPLSYSLAREPAGTWWMGQHQWGSFSGFRMEPTSCSVTDFEPHHRRLATDPQSSFVQTFVCQKPLDDRIVTLRARTLSSVGPSVDEKRVLDAAEFADALRSEFGISESPDRIARLWRRACAQHEAFVSRPAA
jgi:N-hydroxyarylamine O-acetyltransferase